MHLLLSFLLTIGFLKPQLCRVHHTSLQPGRASIRYGKPAITHRVRVMRRRFPNSRETVNGGCVVSEAREIEVYYCAQCRAGWQQWQLAHPQRR